MKNVTPVNYFLAECNMSAICFLPINTAHCSFFSVFIVLSWPNCPAFFNSVGKRNTQELFCF